MSEAQTQRELEFRVLSGEAAREVDPDGIQWPDTALVLYAFEDGKVVGRGGLMDITHIEGVMVAPEKRSGTLGYRLMSNLEDMLRAIGRTHAMAFAHNDTPEVGQYLERLGYTKLPVTAYTKELY